CAAPSTSATPKRSPPLPPPWPSKRPPARRRRDGAHKVHAEPMQLQDRAKQWLAVDPDPDTRRELERLLDDPGQLEERFAGRLEFGTAGLRGALGAGPLRMNRVM